MFDDDDSLRRDEVRLVEKFERADVVFFMVVRRIEKNEVSHEFAGFQAFQAADGVGFDDFGGGQGVEHIEIVFDQLYGAGMRFDEDGVTRAAADRFDADGSGAREKIDEKRVIDGRTEDVEQSFAQLIAGGAHL